MDTSSPFLEGIDTSEMKSHEDIILRFINACVFYQMTRFVVMSKLEHFIYRQSACKARIF